MPLSPLILRGHQRSIDTQPITLNLLTLQQSVFCRPAIGVHCGNSACYLNEPARLGDRPRRRLRHETLFVEAGSFGVLGRLAFTTA